MYEQQRACLHGCEVGASWCNVPPVMVILKERVAVPLFANDGRSILVVDAVCQPRSILGIVRDEGIAISHCDGFRAVAIEPRLQACHIQLESSS